MLRITTDKLSDLNFNIDINHNHDFIPKSESIKKYVDSEIKRVIEESLTDNNADNEHISFISKNHFILRAFFKDSTGTLVNKYPYDFLYKIGWDNEFLSESIYIFDIYDLPSPTNQKLISRNFVKTSKIFQTTSLTNSTDINFLTGNIRREFTNIYIPTYFIEGGLDTVYMKISFFNSNTGKLRHFQVSNSTDSTTDYFKLILDKQYKTYDILNGISINTNPTVYKITEVIELLKEEKEINDKIARRPTNPQPKSKIITGLGKVVTI